MARQVDVLTSDGVRRRSSRVPNLKNLRMQLYGEGPLVPAESAALGGDKTLIGKYEARFVTNKVLDNGQVVKWDERTKKEYNPQKAINYINYWKYGTQTPLEDYKYLRKSAELDKKENTGAWNLRRLLSRDASGGGKVVDKQHQLYIDKERGKLQKNVFPNTSMGRDKLILDKKRSEAAARVDIDEINKYNTSPNVTSSENKPQPTTGYDGGPVDPTGAAIEAVQKLFPNKMNVSIQNGDETNNNEVTTDGNKESETNKNNDIKINKENNKTSNTDKLTTPKKEVTIYGLTRKEWQKANKNQRQRAKRLSNNNSRVEKRGDGTLLGSGLNVGGKTWGD